MKISARAIQSTIRRYTASKNILMHEDKITASCPTLLLTNALGQSLSRLRSSGVIPPHRLHVVTVSPWSCMGARLLIAKIQWHWLPTGANQRPYSIQSCSLLRYFIFSICTTHYTGSVPKSPIDFPHC